jgi:hypothetical protein
VPDRRRETANIYASPDDDWFTIPAVSEGVASSARQADVAVHAPNHELVQPSIRTAIPVPTAGNAEGGMNRVYIAC